MLRLLCMLPVLLMLRILLMAWTSPLTWVANQLVTATQMNTHLRDNLLALYNRPKARYASPNIGASTTSTDWVNVDATNLALALTCTGADVLVLVTASLTWSGGGAYTDRCFLRVTYDDVSFGVYPRVTRYGSDSNFVLYTMAVVKTSVTAGSHTFRLQWMVGGTAGLQVSMSHVEMIVREIG